jgi:hypothetical protein
MKMFYHELITSATGPASNRKRVVIMLRATSLQGNEKGPRPPGAGLFADDGVWPFSANWESLGLN